MTRIGHRSTNQCPTIERLEIALKSALSAPTPACILVYGSDELLLGTRTLVLEKAGYVVFPTLEASEMAKIIASQNISLLVLCHTLAPEKCEAALELAQSRIPIVRNLLLTAGESPCSELGHDALLSAFDGPRKLVEMVETLQSARVASVG
jgi:hypothetical protein